MAQTPYTPYTGEGVAPVNQQQFQGIGNINQYALEAQSPYAQALGLVGGASQQLTPEQIQQYYDPYQQQVIGTTEQQFNEMNKMALNNIQGNAAAQGAIGGDRPGVAQAAYYQGVLPGQEQAIAGLEAQGYNQALATAGQQFQQNPMAAAYGLGSLGTGAQGAALQGAGAQVGAGSLEQQTSQALDQYLYNQYLAQMGYPFALNQYAAGIDTGIGSVAGGTSTGTTTGPPPSLLGQILGLGVAGAGAYGAYQKASQRGGRIRGYQAGGSPIMPYAGAPSYIPSPSGLAHGSGPPQAHAPAAPGQQGGASSMFGEAQQLAGMGKMGQGIGSGLAGLGSGAGAVTPEAWTAAGLDLGTIGPGVADLGAGAAVDLGIGAAADAGAADLLPLLLLAKKGGRIQLPMRSGMGMPSFVRGYQEGGSPNFNEEFADMARQEQLTAQAYGINPSRFADPSVPANISRPGIEGGFEDLADLQAPQPGATAYTPEGRALAFAGDNGGGGGLQPSSYQPPPRLPPSVRPSITPGQGGQGFMGMSPEFWQSLMAMGLGTAAAAGRPGASPLGAIGEGGLFGLKTYGGLKGREADIEMESRKLDQQAQNEADRIRHESEALQQQAQLHREMTPYQKAELALKAQEPKTILGPDSMLHTVRKDPDTGKFIDIFTNQPIDVPSTPSSKEGVPTSQIPSKTQVAQLGEAPDGFRLQTSKATEAGQKYNYAADGPYIEKGMEVPEPGNVTGKSADTLKRDAEYYAATGKGLPPLARGNSPVAMQTNAYRNAVQNYASALSASRGVDPQTQAMMWREAPLYGRFVMGADGRATVSLGTATRHLDTVRQLAQAWQANDVQTVNRLRAVVSREFGGDAATNLDTVGKIVGPEIIKAIGVAGAGTDREREAAAAGFGATASPAQMLGAVDTVQKLLGGQLEGKMRQAKAAGLTDEQFKNLIGDRPYEILSHAGTPGAATTPAAGGLPAGVPQGSTHGVSKSQGPGWKTPDGRFIPDKT